jgi:hypothetical protein
MNESKTYQKSQTHVHMDRWLELGLSDNGMSKIGDVADVRFILRGLDDL